MSESEPPLSLEKIAKTAKALQEIAEALTMAYAIVGRRIRPEYKECAKNFLKISEDVTGFTRNLMEFLAPYYYLSFYKDDGDMRKELQKQFIVFRSRKPRDWISRVKFRCGEIDGYYSSFCKAWVKNSYGEHVAKKKQKAAELLLEELTTIDAALIETLTEQVMHPLEQFIKAADVGLRGADGLTSARSAHDVFRSQITPVFDAVEDALTHLNKAAETFGHLARQH